MALGTILGGAAVVVGGLVSTALTAGTGIASGMFVGEIRQGKDSPQRVVAAVSFFFSAICFFKTAVRLFSNVVVLGTGAFGVASSTFILAVLTALIGVAATIAVK